MTADTPTPDGRAAMTPKHAAWLVTKHNLNRTRAKAQLEKEIHMVKARMICRKNEDNGWGHSVELEALYSADRTDPNYSYSQATPSARLTMSITNPDAYETFVPGEFYELSFKRVE